MLLTVLRTLRAVSWVVRVTVMTVPQRAGFTTLCIY